MKDYIVRFDAYRPIYKDLLKPEDYFSNTGAAGTAQQLALQKKITTDFSQTSNQSGYKYFNELFMKRHSKLLTRELQSALPSALLYSLRRLRWHCTCSRTHARRSVSCA